MVTCAENHCLVVWASECEGNIMCYCSFLPYLSSNAKCLNSECGAQTVCDSLNQSVRLIFF